MCDFSPVENPSFYWITKDRKTRILLRINWHGIKQFPQPYRDIKYNKNFISKAKNVLTCPGKKKEMEEKITKNLIKISI